MRICVRKCACMSACVPTHAWASTCCGLHGCPSGTWCPAVCTLLVGLQLQQAMQLHHAGGERLSQSQAGHHDKEVDDRATQARPIEAWSTCTPLPHFTSSIDRSSNSGYDCLRQRVKRSTDNSSSDSTN